MRRKISKSKKRIIFEKAKQAEFQDSRLWKIDRHGKMMHKAAYGDRNSKYGWNIHHKDGNRSNNNISNLEAVNFVTHKKLH